MTPENVADNDDLSRHLYSPCMGEFGGDLVWQNVFMFPTADGCCESFVWRKYAPTLADVHNLGCAKQAADRAKGKKDSTYTGALTGRVGEVRSIRGKNGARFSVEHKPKDGIHHVHVSFPPTLTKPDKTELKTLIRAKFTDRAGHTCPVAA